MKIFKCLILEISHETTFYAFVADFICGINKKII